MSKIVLINSPLQDYTLIQKPVYTTTAPLGLGYLATILKNSGFDVKLVDAEAEKLSFQEIIKTVSEYNPTVVGINVFSTNWNLSLSLLNNIEAQYKLVGGPHTLNLNSDSYPNISIVQGEVESSIVEIITKKPLGLIIGSPVKNLDTLPFINRNFFINDPYFLENGKKEVSISASRGCPFHCVYCAIPILGTKIRNRSIDNVCNEIEKLQSEGVDSIHFIDDIFGSTKKRIHQFCQEVLKRNLNISWRALFRIDILDRNLLEKMCEAGCYKVAFGIESASKSVLEYIGKPTNLKKIRIIFNQCHKLGLETKAFFTLGYPDETAKQIEKTINFALELSPTEVRFMVVRAFPGTKLYLDMRQRGFTDEDLRNYYQFQGPNKYIKYHVMNAIPLNGMNRKELDNYINEAYRRFNESK